jgi:SNF2 family DNA or RNA helicase
MAGLLIKEMKLREAIERILILCPSPLTIQWQDEMLRWFGESFDRIAGACPARPRIGKRLQAGGPTEVP